MNKISTILFLFLSIITNGQNKNLVVKEIDSIVNRIDSICVSGGVEDYTIEIKKGSKKQFGDGADWFYTDSTKTKLLKVFSEYSIGTQNIELYYFHQNSLIYLKIINFTYDNNTKNINWEGQYYFQDNKLIFKQDKLKKDLKPEIYLEKATHFFGSDKIWRI